MKISYSTTDVRIVSISDIHFGKNNEVESLFNQLIEHFFTYVDRFKPHIIFIAGDLTDKRLTLNSDAAIYCNKFVDKLYNLDCVIVLVHGTLSHDYLQMNSYSHLVSDRFRIIKEKSIEYILGLKILILPEEYIPNPKEYYKEVLSPNQPYDMVVGHGLFQHAGSYASDSLDTLKNKAYVFNAKEFTDIVYGYVSFGHIHTTIKEGNVIYNGSFSRDSHGQEEAKGFYSFIYEPGKKRCKYEFIENLSAPLYISDHFYADDDSNNHIAETISTIKKNALKYHSYRIIPHAKVDSKFYSALVALSRELDNVSILTKYIERDDVFMQVEESDSEKFMREKREKFDGLGFMDVTIKYALEEFQESIKLDDIYFAKTPLS